MEKSEKKGIFVVLEGPEGAGKTTQLRKLQSELENRGHSVVVTREPGGTPLAEQLRELVKQTGAEPVTPAAELLMIEAARAQHVARVIAPALAAGKIVLCDRFTDSTSAYQGYGRGMDGAWIAELNRRVCGDTVPDRVLVFDVDRATGRMRTGKRALAADATDRFEQSDEAFHERVRAGFLALAAAAPERYRVIAAAADPEAVFGQVREAVHELF